MVVDEKIWESWDEHKSVEVGNGIKLHYVDVGPKDAQPVVLVHGWPDLWFGWRHQIQALSPLYRLIVPDLRGFGQSSKPIGVENYGHKNITDDLAGLLDALDIEQAVFIGHDWGGSMVWHMCLYHPERVSAVCGVCTPYTPPNDEYVDLDRVIERLPQFGYQKVLADTKYAASKLDQVPRRFFTAMFQSSKDFSTLPKEEKLPLRKVLLNVVDHPSSIYTKKSSIISDAELNYYVQQYSESGFQTSCYYYATRSVDFKTSRHLPKKIGHQALFIAAQQDAVLRPSMGRNMISFIPHLQTALIEDAGHWVLWEQHAKVNAILLTWLASVTDGKRFGAKL